MDPRAFLSHPRIYQGFQNLLGARRQRRICVREYIRPQAGERVLDCGCGPGDFLHFFPDVDYVGIDIEPRYIEAAREEFGGRGSFRLGPVGADTMPEESQFDLVLAWGLLHHLTDDETVAFLEHAKRALRPSGRFVSLDGCFHEGQSPVARWILRQDRGRHVRTLDAWRALLGAVFPQVDIDLRTDLLRIPYSQIVAVARPTPPPAPRRRSV